MQEKTSLNVLAFLFIAIGIILTIQNYNLVNGASRHWPALIIVLGIGFAMLFFERKRNDAALLWLSAFLIMIGILFYYLNYTSWKQLGFLWPIFLGIVGLSFMADALSTKKKAYILLSILFITLFLALFLVFTVSLNLWPMSLVLFGLSLLAITPISKRESQKNKAKSPHPDGLRHKRKQK